MGKGFLFILETKDREMVNHQSNTEDLFMKYVKFVNVLIIPQLKQFPRTMISTILCFKVTVKIVNTMFTSFHNFVSLKIV